MNNLKSKYSNLYHSETLLELIICHIYEQNYQSKLDPQIQLTPEQAIFIDKQLESKSDSFTCDNFLLLQKQKLTQLQLDLSEHQKFQQKLKNQLNFTPEQLLQEYQNVKNQLNSQSLQIEKSKKIMKNQQDIVQQKTQEVIKLEKYQIEVQKLNALKLQEKDILMTNNSERVFFLSKQLNLKAEEVSDAQSKTKYYEEQYSQLNQQYQAFYQQYSTVNGICAELQFQLKADTYGDILQLYFDKVENLVEKQVIVDLENDNQLKQQQINMLIQEIGKFSNYIVVFDQKLFQLNQKSEKVSAIQQQIFHVNEQLKVNQISRIQQQKKQTQANQDILKQNQIIEEQNISLQNQVNFLYMLKDSKLPAMQKIIQLQQNQLLQDKQVLQDLQLKIQGLEYNLILSNNNQEQVQTKYQKLVRNK